jgi:hypothetical protein
MTASRSCVAMSIAGFVAMVLFPMGCAGPRDNSGGSSGGSGGVGGSEAAGGAGGVSNSGGASASGGTTSTGGTSEPDAPIAAGGAGGNGGAGGRTSAGGSTTSAGGSTSRGGASGTAGSGGTSATGGTAGGGGAGGAGGATSNGGSSGGSGGVGTGGTTTSLPPCANGVQDNGETGVDCGGPCPACPVVYKLPPPDRCHDQNYIPYDYQTKTGCLDGDAATDCGGKCQVINACSETTTSKPHADITFMCQRNQLFSPEMEQAAKDDGLDGFHYAVVGHDVDKGGIDGQDDTSCCQCYQLVYAWPSVANDRQVQQNPDNPNPPASAIPVPAPLIAQAFNTAATPQTFDVYMPAGGLGANNACALLKDSSGNPMTQSASGKYMYTSYPADGQPSNGGVKPVTLYPECKTQVSWVTEATLSSAACVAKFTDACNKIASNIPGLTEQSRNGCIKSNTIDSYYHLNWSVYAMKVECPENLTRVTGCKLAPQGLPAVAKDVKTAAQAAKDSRFLTKTGSTSNMYETTTMEDCCRPSCAAIDWISGRGLKTDPDYRAFYSCDEKGVPYTQ